MGLVNKYMDGRHALIQQFIADDIQFMFGNPGTVEQGFLDVLSEYTGKLKYILSLQESVAVAAADGYARTTKKIGLVQLHSGVGLGNGIGYLYQAFRGHSPLLVIAGDAGVKYDAMDAQMAADLVQMAKPVTKYATRVTHPDSLLRVVRRAIKIALTPPTGPVFVNLPMDVLDAPNSENVMESSVPITLSEPSYHLINSIASILKSAAHPIIIIGDGIAYSGASAEIEKVAKLLGAEVWGANDSEINIDQRCPLYRGSLGHMFGFESSKHVRRADAILICGTYVFPEVFPELKESEVFQPSAKIFHIDLDAYEISKNFRVDIGLVSDPKLTLAKLTQMLESSMSTAERDAAKSRVASIVRSTKDDQESHSRHSIFCEFASILAERLSENACVFDEALTHSNEIMPYLKRSQPGTFFQIRGGSLGLAFPGAIGIKLAFPDRTVFGFCGDGGCLYTIQSLWTAARYNIASKFVVVNNQSYRLLKLNLEEYRKERHQPAKPFPESFDIKNPTIDFATLAKSFGVPSERVHDSKEIRGSIDRALLNDRTVSH